MTRRVSAQAHMLIEQIKRLRVLLCVHAWIFCKKVGAGTK